MAYEKWVTVGTKFCEYIEMDVEMRELRLYPSENLPEAAETNYRVLERHCTGAIPVIWPESLANGRLIIPA
ncbi:MAG: hypothetical protein R3C44_20235 [Chloroflexota bacterium]